MNIHFDSINVNEITKSSGIFVGSNSQNGWYSHCKENVALGTVIGDSNIIHQNINVIHDEDMVDMPVKNYSKQQSNSENGKGQDLT